MSSPLYALVAYVRHPVGTFVENLRRQLHPDHPESPAHITVVPPRCLQGSEEQATRLIQEICREVVPFEVVMGDVETFAPVTPTVFIRVAHAAYRVRELHDKLNVGALAFNEAWPYMPHLTIAKLPDEAAAHRAADMARRQWMEFAGPRHILLEELTFVRQEDPSQSWIDLDSVRLAGIPAQR